MRGIGDALKRRVEQQGHDHQRDRKHLDGDDGAEEDFRIGLNLIFVRNLDLRRGSPGDEDNPRRRLARIRVHAGDEIFGIGHAIAPPSRPPATD